MESNGDLKATSRFQAIRETIYSSDAAKEDNEEAELSWAVRSDDWEASPDGGIRVHSGKSLHPWGPVLFPSTEISELL